jgi:hypothetical protein
MTMTMIESVSTEWSMHLKNMCKQTELYTSTHNPQTFSSEDEVFPVNCEFPQVATKMVETAMQSLTTDQY